MSKMKSMATILPIIAAMASMGNPAPTEREKYGVGMGTVKKWTPSNNSPSSTLTPKQRKARAMSKIQKRSRKINRK